MRRDARGSSVPVPESDNVCFYSQRPREDNILRYDLGDHTDSLDYGIRGNTSAFCSVSDI